MTNKTMVSVPRELLERAAHLLYMHDLEQTQVGMDIDIEIEKAEETTTPAEDVRAVVEEPVDNEQTVYLIVFDDYDVRPETVIGEAAARQRYTQMSNNWNAHLFVKLESNSRDDPHARSNYRHPQRPVVIPEREFYTQYMLGIVPINAEQANAYKDGWNACLDEFARLNK